MDWSKLIFRSLTLFLIGRVEAGGKFRFIDLFFVFQGSALVVTLNLVQVWQFEFPSSWPMFPLLACVATAIGLLYPHITEQQGEVPDTSKVMRCVAVFVGIYQASTVSLILVSTGWLAAQPVLSFGSGVVLYSLVVDQGQTLLPSLGTQNFKFTTRNSCEYLKSVDS